VEFLAAIADKDYPGAALLNHGRTRNATLGRHARHGVFQPDRRQPAIQSGAFHRPYAA
jgi:hypothetical protein